MIQRKIDRPRGILKTGASDRRYRHERYHPSPELNAYVEHYWVVEWDLRGHEPELAETLPHPSVHMIFESDGKSRVSGVRTAKFSRFLENQGGVFGVKFTPAGFYPFVSRPVSSFSNRITPIYNVFGSDAKDLDRALLVETTDIARISLVERFLCERLPEPDPNVQLLTTIVYNVTNDREILKTQDLVERYGLNKRTLQRLFKKYVGVSPKWVIQRYRLHEAAEQLATGGSICQTELALSLGYSDQAHFVRDFKAIVGVTPAAYAQRGVGR